MSDLSTSNIPSQSHVPEPAVLMAKPTIDVLAGLSSSVCALVDHEPIIVQYDAEYEELKLRVLSNLM